MFAAIGSLIGRKPSPTAAPAVPVPFPTSQSGPALRRRQENSRDTYTRIFRWRSSTSGVAPALVEVVGSFTRWQTVSLTHDPLQNTWSVTIEGIPGKRTHHYMLL